MIHCACPQCKNGLTKKINSKIVYYECSQCLGQSYSIYHLRRDEKAQYIEEKLKKAKTSKSTSKNLDCPHCSQGMQTLDIELKSETRLEIEHCPRCYIIWFDQNEKHQLELSPSEIEALEKKPVDPNAKIHSDAKSEPRDTSLFSSSKSPGGHKTLLTIFGLPVEEKNDSFLIQPLITWILLSLSIAISYLAFNDVNLFNFLSFVPNESFPESLPKSFYVFFVHGGWLHLLGNMYFLWIFGDNCEVELGKVKYILLVVLATIAGSYSYYLINPDSMTPLVGASGGISGIIAYYLCRFPFKKFIVFYFFHWFKISALIFGVLYIGKDILGAIMQFSGSTQTSYISHVGGAVVGLLFYLIFNKKKKFS